MLSINSMKNVLWLDIDIFNVFWNFVIFLLNWEKSENGGMWEKLHIYQMFYINS
jgi:hypothetical protein